MDGRLLARFDQLIDEKGYSNRSEAIRDLIRDEVVEHFFTESLM
jgi:CopG family nickel-responsive transcriptional regulator